MRIVRHVKIAALVCGLACGLVGLAAGTAEAARYVARCVAAPACQITCTSNRTTVACHARILPNGRCYRRCFRGN